MTTAIECGQCGQHFYTAADLTTGRTGFYMDEAGHEVTMADILPNLEPGELLTMDYEGRLAYVTAGE